MRKEETLVDVSPKSKAPLEVHPPVCIYIYICIYICVYIWIYIHLFIAYAQQGGRDGDGEREGRGVYDGEVTCFA